MLPNRPSPSECGRKNFIKILHRGRSLLTNWGSQLSVLVKVVGRMLRQQIHDRLVRRHHDCRVGDLSHELRGQAAVEAPNALLLPNQRQRLPEAAVLGALLA